MYYNVALGDAKIFYFLLKKLFNAGTGMRWGYPNPPGKGMRFNFSSLLDMSRVTGKYIRIGYGDGEGKTRPHPAPLPCLTSTIFILMITRRSLTLSLLVLLALNHHQLKLLLPMPKLQNNQVILP